MKKVYTILCLLMFTASISGGYALSQVVEQSMYVGIGVGILFLVGGAMFIRNTEETESETAQ